MQRTVCRHNSPKSRRLLALVAVAVLLSLAGCSLDVFAGGQQGPVNVTVGNAAETNYTFDVSVVSGTMNDREVTIRERDGSEYRVSPGEGLSTYQLDSVDSYATAVELPENRTRNHDRYDLSPGERIATRIADFETPGNVVIVISRGDRAVSLIVAHCSLDLQYVETKIRPSGSDSTAICR